MVALGGGLVWWHWEVALGGGTEGTICKLVAQAPDTKDGGGSLPASALHPGNWGGGPVAYACWVSD